MSDFEDEGDGTFLGLELFHSFPEFKFNASEFRCTHGDFELTVERLGGSYSDPIMEAFDGADAPELNSPSTELWNYRVYCRTGNRVSANGQASNYKAAIEQVMEITNFLEKLPYK